MSQVAIILGSSSDKQYVEGAEALLREFGIEYELLILSAHRTPEATREYAATARDRGIEVLIAAAGMAAHLPGVIASYTTLPVIGVPLPGSELRGLDSLYAMVQMPAGVPVACMAIGSHGARNAALFAVQILALRDARLRDAFATYKAHLAQPRT